MAVGGLITISVVLILPTEHISFTKRWVLPHSSLDSNPFEVIWKWNPDPLLTHHSSERLTSFPQDPFKDSVPAVLSERTERKQPASSRGLISSPFISSSASSFILVPLPLCEMSRALHHRGHFKQESTPVLEVKEAELQRPAVYFSYSKRNKDDRCGQ